MTPSISYLAYKRDTKTLLHWMICSSNQIIRSAPTKLKGHKINTTGHTTVAGLISMSRLIAEHISPIPSIIFRLLQSTIYARSDLYHSFQLVVELNHDPDIEARNATHKGFIDTLHEVFQILGGDAWLAAEKQKHGGVQVDDDELESPILANKFDVLQVEGAEGTEAKDHHEPVDSPAIPGNPIREARRQGNKNNGKKTNKNQTKKPHRATEILSQDCRIIGDDDGQFAEYLLAVHAAVQQWIDFRLYIQDVWKDVAYNGQNFVVAGVASLVAIAMVKRSASALFVDFPDHDSYEIMMKAITSGEPILAKGQRLSDVDPDLKEQYLLHSYEVLVEFLDDFRKKRNMRPTDGMAGKLRTWDPDLNLAQATQQQRLDWRRLYTIRWLYDMVNFCSFSYFKHEKNTGFDGIEIVDWSCKSPWGHETRLFGLDEFASEITRLAFQPQKTDVRRMIRPHHVFQLQCIVDSYTVSRGWSLDYAHGHTLVPPAPGFRANQDIISFIGYGSKHDSLNTPIIGGGLITAAYAFRKEMDANGKDYDSSYRFLCRLIETFGVQLQDVLGLFNRGGPPVPSCFSDNGNYNFWDYSPFLCGVGLVAALEISYDAMLQVWEKFGVARAMIHIHNALLQTGYLKEPVAVYRDLQTMFQQGLYYEGQIPKSRFTLSHEASSLPSLDSLRAASLGTLGRKLRPKCGPKDQEQGSLAKVSMSDNRVRFKMESTLIRWRKAGWEVERVLARHKLGESNPEPRNMHCKPKVACQAESTAEREKARLQEILDRSRPTTSRFPQKYVDKKHTSNMEEPKGQGCGAQKRRNDMFEGREMLQQIMTDISRDLWGPSPFSGVNYMLVFWDMVRTFAELEKEVKTKVKLCRGCDFASAHKLLLDLQILCMIEKGCDPECCQLLANVFASKRTEVSDMLYWKDPALKKARTQKGT